MRSGFKTRGIGTRELMPITRAAELGTCQCGAPVLRGLDLDRAALSVTVDAEPVPVYALWPGEGTRVELHREWQTRHVEHRCPLR